MLLISSLEHGGAEGQVLALAEHLDPDRFETHLCSLSPHLPLTRSLPPRVPVHLIPKRWRFDTTVVTRLAWLLRRHRIDLVHSFLFDAEIAGRLAGRLARVQAVVGSERNSNYVRSFPHSIAGRLTRRLSNALVANSNAGKLFTVRTLGLPESHVYVVYNGVDTDRFQPYPVEALRQRLGLPVHGPVVGMVANFKRQKNYEMFFRVAERVLWSCPDARFVSVGAAMRDDQQGSERYHREMRQLSEELGVRDRILWLGTRDDMPDVYNLFDVAVLTSRREGTPNVLLEAMASGLPTVVTNVADNAVHVRDGVTGFIVAVDDVATMGRRVLALLTDKAARRAMGGAARQRAAEAYSLAGMAGRMASVYEQVLEQRNALPSRPGRR
jgi:glycosyltransferase involved in cell wall biosynthesis